MLPMICLNEPHPQVQQSNAVTMETVLHPQYTGLVSTAILDGAISLYQSLEGFLWPTEHRDIVGQRLTCGDYKAFMM